MPISNTTHLKKSFQNKTLTPLLLSPTRLQHPTSHHLPSKLHSTTEPFQTSPLVNGITAVDAARATCVARLPSLAHSRDRLRLAGEIRKKRSERLSLAYARIGIAFTSGVWSLRGDWLFRAVICVYIMRACIREVNRSMLYTYNDAVGRLGTRVCGFVDMAGWWRFLVVVGCFCTFRENMILNGVVEN